MNKILSKNNFIFKEKLEISNLFTNIYDEKNLIVPANIKIEQLNKIFSNFNNINLRKFTIEENIIISNKTKILFLFVFLKDSDQMIDKYIQLKDKINFDNENYFYLLRRSFINEGVYLVEVN